MTDVVAVFSASAGHGKSSGTYSNISTGAVWGDWGLRTRKVDCRLNRIFKYSFLIFSIPVSHTHTSPKRPKQRFGLSRKPSNGGSGNFALRQDKLSSVAGAGARRPISHAAFAGIGR